MTKGHNTMASISGAEIEAIRKASADSGNEFNTVLETSVAKLKFIGKVPGKTVIAWYETGVTLKGKKYHLRFEMQSAEEVDHG